MKKSIFLLVFFLLPFRVFAQEQITPVEINGDEINYLQGGGVVVASGNVVMKYEDMELYCDEARYNAETNIAHITGNVKIVRGASVIEGDDITYDFNTREMNINKIQVNAPPMYGSAQGVDSQGDESYTLKEGYVTTCDLEEPHYRLVAKKITIYPKKRVVARNVILKIGKTPVFYFPYYSHSLKDRSFPVEIIPGKNSDWGYYVLTRWRYYMGEQNRGKVHLDWYQKRGVGEGVTHVAESEKYGQALFKYYMIKDDLYALENRDDLFDIYPDQRGQNPKDLKEDRYKAQFAYLWQPTDQLTVRSELNKFSDEDFRKEFFEREYENETHPLSYAFFDYGFEHSSLSLLAQKRVNRFFTETEYLPQLAYDFYQQPIGLGNLYFESNSTIGNVKASPAHSGLSHDVLRGHSHNTFSYPNQFAWLHVTPFVESYATYYSKNPFGESDIVRIAPGTGADLSTKLYKVFDTDLRVLGTPIEQIRHVLTPKIGYHYVHDPTVSEDHVFEFDNLDLLERKETITVGIENKWQARNQQRVWDFVYFSPSVEYQLHKEGKGSYFDKLLVDFEVYPKTSLGFSSNAEYDFLDRAVREANFDIRLQDPDGDKYLCAFGYRYARNDDTQGTLSFEYQLSPKFRFKNYLRYEFEDGGFEKQQYSLRTDLHCWWMDVGIDVDRDDEFTFWLTFRLKAFPDISVGFDKSYRGGRNEY